MERIPWGWGAFRESFRLTDEREVGMSVCPKCGGDEMDTAVGSFDSTMAVIGCGCMLCGHEWLVNMVPVVEAGDHDEVVSFREGGRTTAVFEVRLPGDGRPACTVALSATDEGLVVDVFGDDPAKRAMWSPLASLWVLDDELGPV